MLRVDRIGKQRRTRLTLCGGRVILVTMRKLLFAITILWASAILDPYAVSAKAEAGFATPNWAKHVVWYQIFPERFRNGTAQNDPPRTLPWRWDWYKFAPRERPNAAGNFSRDWGSRRFGGDLQGLTEKLPYFHELGVTALYLNPVFESGSNHGYDTIDYRHISEFFGVKGDYGELAGKETLDPSTWQWTASDKQFLDFI